MTKAFKSGNSIAVRLPKKFGVEAGTEMRVREEQGRYVIEPVALRQPSRIDLAALYGSAPGLELIDREEHEFEDTPRDWHLLGLKLP